MLEQKKRLCLKKDDFARHVDFARKKRNMYLYNPCHLSIDKVGFTAQLITLEPRHEISNNVVCATSKASDQPAHTRSLI